MADNYESMVAALKAMTKGGTTATDAETLPMSENAWTTRPDCESYGIVAQDFEGESDDGDNLKQERSWEGSVDLFSKHKRGDGWPAEIEKILTEYCECAWELNGPTWENDSLLFHWEWTFRMEELDTGG